MYFVRESTVFRTAIFLSVLVFSGCSLVGRSDNSSAAKLRRDLMKEERDFAEKIDTSVPPSSERYYQYLLGELALNDGDVDTALTALEKVAASDTTAAPTLRSELARLYVRSNRLDDALQQIEKALASSPNDEKLLHLQAGILSAQKKFAEAAAVYERLIGFNPKDSDDSYVLLANIHAEQGDYATGIAVLKRLVTQKPDSFFGYYYMGRMSELAKDYKAAMRSYEKAVPLAQSDLQVRLDIVRVIALQEKYKEAIDYCKKIVEDHPRSQEARNVLGRLHLATNETESAIQAYEELSSLEDEPGDARFKIALIKLQKKDFQGAIDDLNLVVASHPDAGRARYYLATALVGVKRLTQAFEQLDAIASDHEYFAQARVFASLLYRERKDFSGAIAELDALLEAQPDNIKALEFLVAVQREAEQFKNAAKTLERLIELQPENPQTRFHLGVVYDHIGDKPKAIAAMEDAIRIDAKHAHALNYLGYTFAERNERLDEAEQLIRRALEVEPGNGYYLDSLAWVYYQKGRYADAREQMEIALQSVADDAVILEHYGLILEKLGEKAQAREILKRALELAPNSDDSDAAARIAEALSSLERELDKE